MLGERNFYSELRKDFLHLPPAFKSGITPTTIAQMAELVDALDSKSGYRKVVQVRFLFWALDFQLVKRVALAAALLLFRICQQFASKTEPGLPEPF